MTHLLELGLLAQLLASLLAQPAVEIKVVGDYRFKSEGFVTKIVFSLDEELIAFGDSRGGIQVLTVPALTVKASLPSRTTAIDSRTRSFSAIGSLCFLDRKNTCRLDFQRGDGDSASGHNRLANGKMVGVNRGGGASKPATRA